MKFHHNRLTVLCAILPVVLTLLPCHQVFSKTPSKYERTGHNSKTSLLPYAFYSGKYPYEIKKFDRSIETRLKKVLKSAYPDYEHNSGVESPCVVKEEHLVITGCRAHDCGAEQSFALINVKTGATFAAIVSRADTKSPNKRVFRTPGKAFPPIFNRMLRGELP